MAEVKPPQNIVEYSSELNYVSKIDLETLTEIGITEGSFVKVELVNPIINIKEYDLPSILSGDKRSDSPVIHSSGYVSFDGDRDRWFLLLNPLWNLTGNRTVIGSIELNYLAIRSFEFEDKRYELKTL